MKQEDGKNQANMIPEGEVQCVWVDAGVLSYKICDRNMDCENCPLDKALRGDAGTCLSRRDLGRKGRLSALVERLSRFSVDASRFYHPGHTWTLVESDRRVRVGLDPMLVTLLGVLDGVVLQKPGEKVLRSSSLGEISQGNRFFTVFSPVSGSVREINVEALEAPALVTVSPLEEGWLMTVEPSNLEQDLEHCVTGAGVLSWMLKGLAWVDSYVAPEIDEHRETLGSTLYDGGEFQDGLRDVLSPERYRRLVLGLLAGKNEWNVPP